VSRPAADVVLPNMAGILTACVRASESSVWSEATCPSAGLRASLAAEVAQANDVDLFLVASCRRAAIVSAMGGRVRAMDLVQVDGFNSQASQTLLALGPDGIGAQAAHELGLAVAADEPHLVAIRTRSRRPWMALPITSRYGPGHSWVRCRAG